MLLLFLWVQALSIIMVGVFAVVARVAEVKIVGIFLKAFRKSWG